MKIGDKVDFSFNLNINGYGDGIIEKMYTNSCIVKVENHTGNQSDLEKLNGRLCISKKNLDKKIKL